MQIGTKVRYRDSNLWSYVGVITALGRGKYGGDCVVRWQLSGIASEECLCNLQPAP